ncbi:aminopeptidase [Thermaerobacter subterraneus]|uniref:Leucyl aminopeptidase (Aminopeptidase T) n=1 Tax=Thermaerobacter subterraneus DSM 13965 TaxID=867903 RepID=K6Q0Z1_9FIRM|nr:aminopeptidase [Thermaerobacter subterraneus]EKP94584.1 leucyl aminopeptidase (aminopeptidase T) [Thermaerobacter subterraneus DSM 13965]
MTDPRVRKLAQVLVRYSLGLEAGDHFLIQTSDLATPLVQAIYREALRVGAFPQVLAQLEGLGEIYLKEASEEQLRVLTPLERIAFEEYRHALVIHAPHNVKALSGVDPRRLAIMQEARRPLADKLMSRIGQGGKYCVTLFPTQALAQEAGMSLSDYEEFVFAACRLDDDDPVASWQAVSRRQQRLVAFLNGVREIRVVGDGTDLTLSVAGRTWINADGHINFPDCEVFTGPVEESVRGTIRFSFPGIFQGKEIEDIRLRFEDGRVVEARAARGQDLLEALLGTDEGARYVGEFAIGTNDQITRFSRNLLFDEKIGGTVHLALGASYPITGGKNRSAIHWDMICDLRQGGEIYADGELIYREGRFLIEG